MRSRTLAIGGLLGLLACPAAAGADGWSGAAVAPSTGGGGTQYGLPMRAARAKQPVAVVFRVSPRVVAEGGAPPRIALRIDQRGVARVAARVVFTPLGSKGRPLRIDLGRVRTGQVLRVRWPSDRALVAGRYVVRVHARGPGGAVLRRRARASGRAALTVRPKPVAPVAPVAPVDPVAPVVPPVSSSGVFPVAGPHGFGAADGRFGAARDGHVHQGQDIVAARGLPVVAPLAGTILTTGYQKDGAGWYVVENAADGRAFFFAHCMADSVSVSTGQAVAAGGQLCQVGSTGSSTGPHLHFEIWVGGWRVSKASAPVDPLAQLQAWDR